jgi:hypothetical protein
MRVGDARPRAGRDGSWTMTIKPGVRDLLWMAAGAALLLALTLVVVPYAGVDQKGSERFALREKRLDLVDRIRLGLASASEAEKSAVLAASDQASQANADQARTATAEVESERVELAGLLASGTPEEKESFEQFSKRFLDFQRVDGELLALAVKNTNLKAYNLAFGPAAGAIKELDSALSNVIAKSAAWPNAMAIASLAFAAQASALRVQALLAPHIAEETDSRMDEMEAQMTGEDRAVVKNLDDLATFPKLKGDPDLAAAISSYKRFGELRMQILALSRENTNVRSLALSLNQKRKVMTVCQDALGALRTAILAEPIPGVDYGRFGRPIQPR